MVQQRSEPACDAFCTQQEAKRLCRPVPCASHRTGESLATASPSSAWHGPCNSAASASVQCRDAGCCPVTRASCPGREQQQRAPRSLSPEEDRQEQATAASGCAMSVSSSLPGYAAARQTVKQGRQAANPEGGWTAGVAFLTHLPLGNGGGGVGVVSHGAISHTDVTNH